MKGGGKCVYGRWNEDKPQEPGFTKELLSIDVDKILDRCTLDTLDASPYEGVDTLLKALRRSIGRIPNHEFLGGRVGDHYEWYTFKEAGDLSEQLSHGMVALDMIPEVEAEDKKWRFTGIQSKNR